MASGFGLSGTIIGLKETVEALRGLPGKIQRRILRPALMKATKPILMTAKRLAPQDTGLLKKSLARKVVTYTKTGTLVVIIGPNEKSRVEVKRRGRAKPMIANPAKYAHLVEFGTRPHSLFKDDKLARTSAAAQLANLRHIENVHRWTVALTTAKTDKQRAALEKKIQKSTRFAAGRREDKQTEGAKQHPGAKPRPFLRPAFDQTKAQVADIFAKAVSAEIEKMGAKVRGEK